MMTVSCPAHRTIFDAQDARINPPEGPYVSRKPFRDTQSVLADSCYRKSTRAIARFAHFLALKKGGFEKIGPRREPGGLCLGRRSGRLCLGVQGERGVKWKRLDACDE